MNNPTLSSSSIVPPGKRPLSDFPQLLEKENYNLKYRFDLSYFEDGLDPSIIVDMPDSHERLLNYITKTQSDSQKLTRFHILYLLLNKIRRTYDSPEKQEVENYFCEHFTRLYKEGKIPQQLANDTAFLIMQSYSDLNIFEHLIKNKVVSINAKTLYGHTFLMQVQDKKSIDMLVKLGIDVNATVSNPTSLNFGKTAYDIAISLHKKAMISYLKPYMLEVDIQKHESSLLNKFKIEVNIKKQMKIFMTSLKDGNQAIIDEISAHQEKYKTLIEYKDAYNKDLLRQCTTGNSSDIALKVMNLDYYQKNKEQIMDPRHIRGDCYCSYAINTNKLAVAKALFQQGFYKKNELIKCFEDMYLSNVAPTVFNLFLDSGYDPDLSVRWLNESHHKLDEKLNSLPLEEIEKFIQKISFMLDLGATKVYDGNHISYNKNNFFQDLTARHIRFFCHILHSLRVKNNALFEKMFSEYFKNLNKANDKVFEYFTLVTLTQFPNDKDKILSLLQSDKPFVIKLQKGNLEKELDKFQAKEVKKFKI